MKSVPKTQSPRGLYEDLFGDDISPLISIIDQHWVTEDQRRIIHSCINGGIEQLGEEEMQELDQLAELINNPPPPPAKDEEPEMQKTAEDTDETQVSSFDPYNWINDGESDS